MKNKIYRYKTTESKTISALKTEIEKFLKFKEMDSVYTTDHGSYIIIHGSKDDYWLAKALGSNVAIDIRITAIEGDSCVDVEISGPSWLSKIISGAGGWFVPTMLLTAVLGIRDQVVLLDETERFIKQYFET